MVKTSEEVPGQGAGKDQHCCRHLSTVTDTPIMLEGEALDEMESFTYLGSIVDNTGGQKLGSKSSHRQSENSFPTAEECLEIITSRHQH